MSGLSIIIGIVLGILILGFIIYLIIKIKLKLTLGEDYDKLKLALKEGVKEFSNAKENEYSRVKSIGGITNLVVPNIQKDFNDFNVNNFFNKIENDLSCYLSSISKLNKDKIHGDKDFILIREKVENMIDDMIENDIKETYKQIKFNKHAIKSYKKENGAATISTSTSLSYYYNTNKDVKHYTNLKKEARIDCEYVYVYDEDKFNEKHEHFGLHCPNCGAPLRDLSGNCLYCKIKLEPINLRAWKVSNIKIVN